jgi:hypothetical protein
MILILKKKNFISSYIAEILILMKFIFYLFNFILNRIWVNVLGLWNFLLGTKESIV